MQQRPCRASRCRSSDWEPSAFETRAEPISLCRKRSFATGWQGRRPASAAVCRRIPCLILCLASVKRVCQCRPPNSPCGLHGRMASVIASLFSRSRPPPPAGLHATTPSVGQTSGATQRCLNPGFSERIGNSRRTPATRTFDQEQSSKCRMWPVCGSQIRNVGSKRRCCMNTRCGWGGVARTSRDPPQEPHYGDEVEGSSHV